MVQQKSLLVSLIMLVDRIPIPPPPKKRGRGRPKFYQDRLFLKALIIMIVRNLHKVIVPHTSIDTDADWSKSGHHGWVYGWKLHLVCTVASVWILPSGGDVAYIRLDILCALFHDIHCHHEATGRIWRSAWCLQSSPWYNGYDTWLHCHRSAKPYHHVIFLLVQPGVSPASYAEPVGGAEDGGRGGHE